MIIFHQKWKLTGRSVFLHQYENDLGRKFSGTHPVAQCLHVTDKLIFCVLIFEKKPETCQLLFTKITPLDINIVPTPFFNPPWNDNNSYLFVNWMTTCTSSYSKQNILFQMIKQNICLVTIIKALLSVINNILYDSRTDTFK